MDEIDQLDAIAQEQQMARKKGHARIALRNKEPYLMDALSKFITLPRIAEDLAGKGVTVSVASLRKWLMEFLPEHYTEYLKATGRGRKANRSGAIEPGKVDAEIGGKENRPQPTAGEMAEALERWLKMEERRERQNRRGAGYALLNPMRSSIALLMRRGKSMKDIHRALDEALGVQVNIKTLRKFVVENMWDEYQACMSDSRAAREQASS